MNNKKTKNLQVFALTDDASLVEIALFKAVVREIKLNKA